jgi:hypothetical protein
MGANTHDLFTPFSSDRLFQIVLDDEQGIQASGDSLTKALIIHFNVKRSIPGSSDEQGWLLRSVALFPDSGHVFSWADSGLQSPQSPITLHLLSDQIDQLDKAARAHAEKAAVLWLRATVIMPKSVLREADKPHYPPIIPFSTGVFRCKIHAAKWHRFLEKWGYPSVGLIPLTTTLPPQLEPERRPVAAKTWGMACEHLLSAQELRRAANWGPASEELWPATECALYAWCAVWGNDEPANKQSVAEAINFLAQSIPHCKPDQGLWPERNDCADARRLCAKFAVLRSLQRAVQELHYRAVYTPEDIDCLLTSTIATLASLPALWKQYPDPLIRPNSHKQPERPDGPPER